MTTALRPDKTKLAGLRRTYRNPITGGWNSVYDGGPAGMDTEAGRWQTVCEEHGTVISHATKRLARAFAPHAEEWCEECGDEQRAAKHELTTGTSRGTEGKRTICYGHCSCGWGTTNSANMDSVRAKHARHVAGTATRLDGFMP